MRSLIARLKVIAATDEVVLVLGESGTGKELVSRAVHQESRRREHPFVPFNCSALSRELMESRLFGYRKGAFTGAHGDHQGVIGAAAGGSVFLDEIGDLTLEAQGALLRFLNSREIQPVGAIRPVIAESSHWLTRAAATCASDGETGRAIVATRRPATADLFTRPIFFTRRFEVDIGSPFNRAHFSRRASRSW